MKYIRIKLHGGGSFLVPRGRIGEAVSAELETLEKGDVMTFDFEMVEMTEEEYENLGEFEGH